MAVPQITFTDNSTVIPSTWLNGVTSELNTLAGKASPVLALSVASFSTLPQTVTNSNITADMVVVNSVLGTPSAQTGDWTVTTSAGSLTIAGNISGSTTLTLYLANGR